MSTTELRHAREQLGLSLRDVADRTRIRLAILDAIENHDAARLPPLIFTRGFVKAYAREVGLDPDATAARYAASLEGAAAPSDHTPAVPHTAVADLDGITERERSSLATAALIVVAGLLYVLINPWQSAPPPDNAASATAVATTGEAPLTVPPAP